MCSVFSTDGVDGGQVQMRGPVLCRLNPWREELKAQLSTVGLQPTCVCCPAWEATPSYVPHLQQKPVNGSGMLRHL